ncbi:MAG: hypothetical protein V4448_06865 [Pseudomonadota bacterium]
MNISPLVQAIQQRLRTAGYSDLPTPFSVAGVQFSFTGAMHGQAGRSLDLVLMVDTTTGDFGDRVGSQVQQRVEALSRALDVTGSRYVVTVILVGAVLSEGVETLSETCRVLQVENIALDELNQPAGETATIMLDDRIRLLLPLTLPTPIVTTEDGSGPAMEQLARALPSNMNRALMDAVIAASSGGEQAVTGAMAMAINAAFVSEPG